MGPQWHVYGMAGRHRRVFGVAPTAQLGPDLGFLVGAGEGNRTLMTSLEGWGSAIELRPRGGHIRRNRAQAAKPVAYRLATADWSLRPRDSDPGKPGPASRRSVGTGDVSPCSMWSGARYREKVGYGWPTGM